MRASAAAIAILLFAVAGVARADALDDAIVEARVQRVPALARLATWCQEKKLYASRNAIAEEILRSDPTHVRAHRWLKHRLKGDDWVAPTRPPTARDLDVASLTALPVRRTAEMLPIAQAIRGALAEHTELVSPGRRERVLRQILELIPTDTRAHEEHGDVKVGATWVLAETAAARLRAPEIAKRAKAAIAAVPAPRQLPEPMSCRDMGLTWVGVVKTSDVFVAATTSRAEAERTVIGCQATPAVFAAAFGIEQVLPPGLELYNLLGAEEAEKFIALHPKVDDDTRRVWRSYGGITLGATYASMSYHLSEEWRVEASVARAARYLLYGAFSWDLGKKPWAAEAFRRYLTWHVTHTRVTFTRRESEYADQARERAAHDQTRVDWYVGALKTLRSWSPADLHESLGKPVNRITLDDARVGNAIAAYYVEGRPDEAEPFVRALGGDTPTIDVFRDVSGLDLEALRLRLIQWLEERL